MSNNALIIGYGASGKAATTLLTQQGYDVFVFDDQYVPIDQRQLKFEQLDTIDFKIAILSPGVHPQHQVCLKVKELNIPIMGEAQFALNFLPQRKIGITGTNGKTTVTYLCEYILKLAGYNAIACGNVSKEKALSHIALSCPLEAILCVELSSFQLETLDECAFEAGIILNITPDHLDRYASMQEYAQSKFRLRDLSNNFYVFKEVIDQFPSLHKKNDIIYHIGLDEPFLNIVFESYIDKANFFAAYLLLKSFDIPDAIFTQAFASFQKPKHRLQKVATIAGIEFINDSKATNIDATIQALRSLTRPVILLAGGVDKGHPYVAWQPYLQFVKKIVCFGSSKDIIYEQLSCFVSCEVVSSLQEAIVYAYSQANRGDVILLSPGCSSFDQFKDYQDRGETFCQNVHNLKSKETVI